MLTATRPNPERDLLAGYQLPSIEAIGIEIPSIIADHAPHFDEIHTSVCEEPLHLTHIGRVLSATGRQHIDPGDYSLGTTVTVSAVSTEDITWENELEYMQQVGEAKLAVAGLFDRNRTAFVSYLREQGRSAAKASSIASQRMQYQLIDLRTGSDYVLDPSGKRTGNRTDVGYVTIDRLCDVEGTKDELSRATVTNMRDITHVSRLVLHFA